jgi:anti-anti-sigma regulatory factor
VSVDDRSKEREAIREAIRGAMGRAAKLLALQTDDATDSSVELEPFIECAERALSERTANSARPSGMSWNEARSMAWLFAHRMADHRVSPAVVCAGIMAWRDAVRAGAEPDLKTWVEAGADELIGLAIEGYARGVEEREQLRAQKALAESAPVRELEPGFLLAIAAGPMDMDGAQAFAERVSRDILRRDAKVIVLDVGDLDAVTPAVLAELWAIVISARTLGARAFVGGVRGMVHEVLATSGITDEGETRVPLVSEAVKLAREALHPPVVSQPFWKRWMGRAR